MSTDRIVEITLNELLHKKTENPQVMAKPAYYHQTRRSTLLGL